MTTFDTKLLLPPEEEASLPPYRPVWRAVGYEMALLVAGALVIYFGASLLNIQIGAARRPLTTALLAIAPLGLWLLFSWRGERRVQHPRRGLLTVLVISALVANAVAAPFIEQLVEPDKWLNALPGITRILGHMVTVGLTVEFLKYLVLRYVCWPKWFERRVDCVAYSMAVSLAFATVFNLRFALLEGGAQPGAAAIRIVSVVLAQQGIGLVVSYRLMTLKFGQAGMFSLATGLLIGSFLHGVYTAFRAGFVVGGFGIGATANVPLMGLGFSVAFAGGLFAVFSFLISAADARDVQMSRVG